MNHTLVGEGVAFVWREDGRLVRVNSHCGTSGQGRGLCSCGDTSEVLPSGNQRRFWHREHKAAMEAAE